jgi:murein DD-endopeptidase MepM/ murein hydrolase activator NlpD
MREVRTRLVGFSEALERNQRYVRKFRTMLGMNESRSIQGLAIGPISRTDSALSPANRDLASVDDVLLDSFNSGVAADGSSAQGEGRTLPFQQITSMLEKLTQETNLQEVSMQEAYEMAQDNASRWQSTPSIRPATGWITSAFGYRTSQFTGYKKMHTGVDIANRIGTPIKAPADGIVTFAGSKAGYGNFVVISHGYGIVTRYGHLSKFYVQVGDRVKRGDRIAALGNTGRSTGPHLHYEVVMNGISHDPELYFMD